MIFFLYIVFHSWSNLRHSPMHPRLTSWSTYTVHGQVQVRSGQISWTMHPNLKIQFTLPGPGLGSSQTGSRRFGPGPVQVWSRSGPGLDWVPPKKIQIY